MKKLTKHINILFWTSLVLSIGIPIGIICIVFGGIKNLIALLLLGIALTVAGFYAMPVLWVKYAEMRVHRNFLRLIENENILNIEDLATHTGKSPEDVEKNIKYLINKGYLTGYLFKTDHLEVHNKKNNGETKKCANCGAKMNFDGEKYVCSYCDNKSN